jgi:hypothetical protein
MFILGHTGIAAAAVHALDRRADLRLVPIAALLPDLLDKPLALLAPGFAQGWTRLVGHSLSGLALFALVATLRIKWRAWPLVLAYGLHLVLDRMWQDGHILLWPFMGFALEPHHVEPWWQRISDSWTIGGEVSGFVLLSALAVRGRLWDRERRRAFLRTGCLVASAP